MTRRFLGAIRTRLCMDDLSSWSDVPALAGEPSLATPTRRVVTEPPENFPRPRRLLDLTNDRIDSHR